MKRRSCFSRLRGAAGALWPPTGVAATSTFLLGHREGLARDNISSCGLLRPGFRLSATVGVHRPDAQLVGPRFQVVQGERPTGNRVTQRPFLRLAGLGVEAPEF